MPLIVLIIAVLLLWWLVSVIKEHWPIVLAVILIGISILFLGIQMTIAIALSIALIVWLCYAIRNAILRHNERSLKRYLKKNCMQLGYMTKERWHKLLPKYASKHYRTDFDMLTANFAESVENAFFGPSSDLSWFNVYADYLKKGGVMAPAYELEQIPNKAFDITHVTPNGKLIYDALSNFSKVKTFNGRPLLSEVELSEEGAVRQDLKRLQMIPLSYDGPIPSYYKKAFKLSDEYIASMGVTPTNFESEEIELDDL